MPRAPTPPAKANRKPAPQPSDQHAKRRAEELLAAGLPLALAQAVARGRMDLNSALSRLAESKEVERLIQKHDLSRALATQIAKGHADLQAVLAKRRMESHLAANLNRSALDEHATSGKPLTLLLHGGRRATGRVLRSDVYTFEFIEDGKAQETVHKLQAQWAYEPDAWKSVRKVLKRDKSAGARGPIDKPQDRYTCSDRRLFKYLDDKTSLEIALLEGDEISGTIEWFGRYEIGVRARPDCVVWVFRHALARLDPTR